MWPPPPRSCARRWLGVVALTNVAVTKGVSAPMAFVDMALGLTASAAGAGYAAVRAFAGG